MIAASLVISAMREPLCKTNAGRGRPRRTFKISARMPTHAAPALPRVACQTRAPLEGSNIGTIRAPTARRRSADVSIDRHRWRRADTTDAGRPRSSERDRPAPRPTSIAGTLARVEAVCSRAPLVVLPASPATARRTVRSVRNPAARLDGRRRLDGSHRPCGADFRENTVKSAEFGAHASSSHIATRRGISLARGPVRRQGVVVPSTARHAARAPGGGFR